MDAEHTRSLVARVRAWTDEHRRRVSLRVLEQRPLFDVEAASACNMECAFCPRDAMTRSEQIMSLETFERVRAFLPDGAVVMFSGLGDALLNPHLERFVAALRARSIGACVITNGLRLMPPRARSLIDAGLEEFQVSVHGLDGEALQRVVTIARAAKRDDQRRVRHLRVGDLHLRAGGHPPVRQRRSIEGAPGPRCRDHLGRTPAREARGDRPWCVVRRLPWVRR